nr:uncharacterized protein LOC117274007 [Nicotiana tomentosiformis]
MVRTRSTSSYATNNVEIPAGNHQEALTEVQIAPMAPVTVRGRGKGNQARGRATGHAQAPPQQADNDQNFGLFGVPTPPAGGRAASVHAPPQDPHPSDEEIIEDDFQAPLEVPPPVVPANIAQPVQLPTGKINLHAFLRLKPPTYNGTYKTNEPMLLLEEIEEMFVSLGCLETQATKLIGFRLKGASGKWWRGYKKTRDSTLPPLTWPQFKKSFRAKLLPSSRIDELLCQFEHLK